MTGEEHTNIFILTYLRMFMLMNFIVTSYYIEDMHRKVFEPYIPFNI